MLYFSMHINVDQHRFHIFDWSRALETMPFRPLKPMYCMPMDVFPHSTPVICQNRLIAFVICVLSKHDPRLFWFIFRTVQIIVFVWYLLSSARENEFFLRSG